MLFTILIVHECPSLCLLVMIFSDSLAGYLVLRAAISKLAPDYFYYASPLVLNAE